MSMDSSLKSKSTLERHRNVLSRAERIAILTETGVWTKEKGATGLPKVAHRKAAVGKKGKVEKKAGEGAEAAPAEGAATAAPTEPAGKTAVPAKPAAAAKPTAGAKPAAKGAKA